MKFSSFFWYNRIFLSIMMLFFLILPISAYAQNATTFNATKLLSSGNPLAPSPTYAAMYSALVTSGLLLAVTIFIYEVIKISVKRNSSNTSDAPTAIPIDPDLPVTSTPTTSSGHTGTFSDIIRTKDGYLSLSYLQLLIWTYVISFTFLFIYFFRMFCGDYTLYGGILPENLLALLGISVGATVSSRMIGEKPPEINNNVQQNSDTEKENNQSENNDREFHTLFYGAKQQFTLSKFQMFLWTVICVTIYVVLFLLVVNNAVYSMEHVAKNQEQKLELVENLTIPNVDNVMLVLMGISQASYLGVKLSEKDFNKNTQVGGKT